ncbi:YifB family Mg chelatase-like AAA ATPase [Caldicellulosiruptoraceae bacterium PP1]
MLSKVTTLSYIGIKGFEVTVEADITNGIPSFDIVGLPDTTIKEAKERVRLAIKNSGFEFPTGKITINLAPASTKKEGSSFDLPIAVAILKSSEQIINNSYYAIIGELSLDGQVKKVSGALLMTIAAYELGFKNIIVPYENRNECAVVKGINVFPVTTLKEAVDLINGENEKFAYQFDINSLFNIDHLYDVDFSEVKGQEYVKRAVEIAVAGMHNLLMIGPPGSGKTMISRRIPTILPQMTFEESLEVTKIYSSAGLISENEGLITKRPFRTPHHTASSIALIGGGKIPKPGEVSLAHNGVLFLDEFPEFDKRTIEVLRQPLEDGIITISRANATVTYPARFMLVASMNPCPCGFYLSEDKECTCLPHQVKQYMGKISKPIQDRIDIHIEVKQVSLRSIDDKSTKDSKTMRENILKAREIQLERFKNAGINFNSQMKPSQINKYCRLNSKEKELMENAFDKLKLSFRAYSKILKVSRTIADLEGSQDIKSEHLLEAINYRILDRLI